MKHRCYVIIISIMFSLILHLSIFIFINFTPLFLKEDLNDSTMIFADVIILPKNIVMEEKIAVQNHNTGKIGKEKITAHSLVANKTMVCDFSGVSNIDIEVEPEHSNINVERPIIMPQLPSPSKMNISQDESFPLVVEEISSKEINNGIYLPSPIYPKSAIEESLEGEVVVELLIGRSGIVTKVTVIKSSGHSILDQVCVNTIQEEWVFAPADRIRKTTKRFVFSLQ